MRKLFLICSLCVIILSGFSQKKPLAIIKGEITYVDTAWVFLRYPNEGNNEKVDSVYTTIGSFLFDVVDSIPDLASITIKTNLNFPIIESIFLVEPSKTIEIQLYGAFFWAASYKVIGTNDQMVFSDWWNIECGFDNILSAFTRAGNNATINKHDKEINKLYLSRVNAMRKFIIKHSSSIAVPFIVSEFIEEADADSIPTIDLREIINRFSVNPNLAKPISTIRKYIQLRESDESLK